MDSAADTLAEGFLVAQLSELAPVDCPCGTSRRAFGVPGNDVATIHEVEISKDSRVHYHKRLTEIYYVLEGEGHIELNGDRVEARPGTAVLIRPGTRHRAVGALRVLVIPIPAFDPADEWFDD